MSERTLTVYLAPGTGDSCVLLDGQDISHLLRGLTVSALVGLPHMVTLYAGAGTASSSRCDCLRLRL